MKPPRTTMATPSLPETLAGLQLFAERHLGPASRRLLDDPAQQALLAARLRSCAAAEDALLSMLHARGAEDPAAAEEFLQFFFEDLQRLGHGRVAVGLRRFVETGDLVQSVVGDLWPQVFDLEFQTRDAFLALLAARVRWKARDRARGLHSGRRREDLRVGTTSRSEDTPDPWEGTAGTPGPMTELVAREEYEAMVLVLHRLPERDRRLLRAHLAGMDWDTLAEQEGQSRDTVRKAVQRALERAREDWRRRADRGGEA